MAHERAAAPIVKFIKAFDEQDFELFAAVLHPDVVIHASRGPRHGIDEALGWARRIDTGELEQRIELDHIEMSEPRAVAMIRRQFWWQAHHELAREEQMAWLFELRNGLVVSWRPFDDRAEALAALA